MGKQSNSKRKALRVSHERQEPAPLPHASSAQTAVAREETLPSVTLKHKENSYHRQVVKLKSTIPHWNNLFSEQLTEEERMNDWIRIEVHLSLSLCPDSLQVLGEPLLQKYAWAIPDRKALGILQRFSPIVEMGAGKGYWAHLLQQQGVEITVGSHGRHTWSCVGVEIFAAASDLETFRTSVIEPRQLFSPCYAKDK
jgi:hypothetical protein